MCTEARGHRYNGKSQEALKQKERGAQRRKASTSLQAEVAEQETHHRRAEGGRRLRRQFETDRR